MADSDKSAANKALLDTLFDSGLDKLFDDERLCSYFKESLKEAGCSPPFHIIVFTVIKKAAVLGWGFGGQALQSRFFAFLARNERLCRLLDRMANICRTCEDRNRLKDMMISELRGDACDGPEPKIDDATDAEVLTQLYSKARFDRQDQLLEALAETLQDVLTEKSGDAIALYLNWPPGNTTTIADSIRYNSGLYAFEEQGRAREIDLLDRFCGDVSKAVPSNRFSWLLMTGPGGEGKTRLALEYTTHRIAPNWRAGRLSVSDLAQFRHGDWLPSQPTMIVIDYPAQSPNPVHALLSNLARRYRAFDWPVRVLLLEREAEGQWFDRIFSSTGDGAAIRARAFAPEGSPLLGGVRLGPIGPLAIVSMMVERFGKANLEPPEPELLLGAAHKVDNRMGQTEHGPVPMPRPLFAAAAAEVMIGALRRGETIDADWLGALDREAVLAEIIKRDREMHWLPSAGGNLELLTWHENLVALATLAGGLKRADLRESPPDVAALLPSPGEAGDRPLREDLVRRMSGYDGGRIAPLEPDLLGEYFVLERLARLGEIEGREARRSFCAAAFAFGGMEGVGSALRTAIDFADRTEAVDWLLPAPHANEAALKWASGMVVDLTARFGQRTYRAMEWLREIEATTSTNAEIAHHEAMATVNMMNHVGDDEDWKRVDVMFERLDRLRTIFHRHAKIALEEAKAAFNAVSDLGKATDWDRINALFRRFDRLHIAFPKEAEIAYREAKSAFNASYFAANAGEQERADAAFARFSRLRAAFPTHVEIALEEAQAAVNMIHHATNDQDWKRADTMLERFDRLRIDLPNHIGIAREEAKAVVNLMGDARMASDAERVDAAFKRLDRLRENYPDDAEIALEELKTATNIASHALRARNWEQIDTVIARASVLAASQFAVELCDSLLRLQISVIAAQIDAELTVDPRIVEGLLTSSEITAKVDIKAHARLLGMSFILVKYLQGHGFAEMVAGFIDIWAERGLDWEKVQSFDEKGGDS